MEKWFFEVENNVFRNRLDKSVITYEQYEQLRGKYHKPTDELLDALVIIISKKIDEKLESNTNLK